MDPLWGKRIWSSLSRLSPNGIDGLDVLEWIQKKQVPYNKRVTYLRHTASYRPEKVNEPFRVQIYASGNLLQYDNDVTTHTSSMETIKTHWNSVISTPNTKYCTGDISNIYLMSDLINSEYVKFKVDMIPPCIVAHYDLKNLIHNGYIYAKIKKAWYGLKQAGGIAHNDLVQHLKKHGFVQAEKTDGLFRIQRYLFHPCSRRFWD